MENNNTVINALSQFITSTINSYIQTMSSQKISMEDILQSLMKSYNSFLLNGFTEVLKREITNKTNTEDGKSTKAENK
jgi:hypothetical protein